MNGIRFVLLLGWAAASLTRVSAADEAPPASSRKSSAPASVPADASSNRLETRDFAEFRAGRDFKEISAAIQGRGNLQMAASLDGEWISAVSYAVHGGRFGEGDEVLALFRDGKFDKWVRWPEGTAALKVGEFPMLEKAAKQPAIPSLERFELDLKAEAAKHRNAGFDPGLAAVALAVSPLLVTHDRQEVSRNTRIRQQFNPLNIARGMSRGDVAKTFRAEPLETYKWSRGEMELFGSREPIDLIEDLRYANILVLYDEQGVSGLYSGYQTSESSRTLESHFENFPARNVRPK